MASPASVLDTPLSEWAGLCHKGFGMSKRPLMDSKLGQDFAAHFTGGGDSGARPGGGSAFELQETLQYAEMEDALMPAPSRDSSAFGCAWSRTASAAPLPDPPCTQHYPDVGFSVPPQQRSQANVCSNAGGRDSQRTQQRGGSFIQQLVPLEPTLRASRTDRLGSDPGHLADRQGTPEDSSPGTPSTQEYPEVPDVVAAPIHKWPNRPEQSVADVIADMTPGLCAGGDEFPMTQFYNEASHTPSWLMVMAEGRDKDTGTSISGPTGVDSTGTSSIAGAHHEGKASASANRRTSVPDEEEHVFLATQCYAPDFAKGACGLTAPANPESIVHDRASAVTRFHAAGSSVVADCGTGAGVSSFPSLGVSGGVCRSGAHTEATAAQSAAGDGDRCLLATQCYEASPLVEHSSRATAASAGVCTVAGSAGLVELAQRAVRAACAEECAFLATQWYDSGEERPGASATGSSTAQIDRAVEDAEPALLATQCYDVITPQDGCATGGAAAIDHGMASLAALARGAGIPDKEPLRLSGPGSSMAQAAQAVEDAGPALLETLRYDEVPPLFSGAAGRDAAVEHLAASSEATAQNSGVAAEDPPPEREEAAVDRVAPSTAATVEGSAFATGCPTALQPAEKGAMSALQAEEGAATVRGAGAAAAAGSSCSPGHPDKNAALPSAAPPAQQAPPPVKEVQPNEPPPTEPSLAPASAAGSAARDPPAELSPPPEPLSAERLLQGLLALRQRDELAALGVLRALETEAPGLLARALGVTRLEPVKPTVGGVAPLSSPSGAPGWQAEKLQPSKEAGPWKRRRKAASPGSAASDPHVEQPQGTSAAAPAAGAAASGVGAAHPATAVAAVTQGRPGRKERELVTVGSDDDEQPLCRPREARALAAPLLRLAAGGQAASRSRSGRVAAPPRPPAASGSGHAAVALAGQRRMATHVGVPGGSSDPQPGDLQEWQAQSSGSAAPLREPEWPVCGALQEQQVQQIYDMGFTDRVRALRALGASDGDLSRAVDLLLSGDM
mmetsp:Transcript_3693/g.10144  ORF Transcript_3693/g.10144 Transcript_3693/m.10144 type:complete len:1016 (-) Transcript_3693:37-3084(-)